VEKKGLSAVTSALFVCMYNFCVHRVKIYVEFSSRVKVVFDVVNIFSAI
jgi:hypothetical protein